MKHCLRRQNNAKKNIALICSVSRIIRTLGRETIARQSYVNQFIRTGMEKFHQYSLVQNICHSGIIPGVYASVAALYQLSDSYMDF